MGKTVRDEQIVIRVSSLLRGELERAADAENRKLADKVRAVLIDYVAAQREQAAA